MAKSKINNSDFTPIRMWMIQELKLTGNDLLVYSVIYKYSIGKLGLYYGGYEHIQTSTGASRNTVIRSLEKLTDEGIILKQSQVLTNGLLRNYYRVNFDILEEIQSEDLKDAFQSRDNTDDNWQCYYNFS